MQSGSAYSAAGKLKGVRMQFFFVHFSFVLMAEPKRIEDFRAGHIVTTSGVQLATQAVQMLNP
jgi:hypothetical protein